MDIVLLRASLTDSIASRDEDPGLSRGTSTQASSAAGHLSLEGRRLVRAIGNKLRLTESLDIGRVIAHSSPAAIQTAELFADRLDFVGKVEVLATLGGQVPPETVAPTLLSSTESLVVVADEPWLSQLGAYLVSRPTFPPLEPAQVSVLRDRNPAFFMRATELERGLLLLA